MNTITANMEPSADGEIRLVFNSQVDVQGDLIDEPFLCHKFYDLDYFIEMCSSWFVLDLTKYVWEDA